MTRHVFSNQDGIAIERFRDDVTVYPYYMYFHAGHWHSYRGLRPYGPTDIVPAGSAIAIVFNEEDTHEDLGAPLY